jgi:uncharacterized protein YndB with AHSA1/START domain
MGRTDTASRSIAAPPERVYDALISAEDHAAGMSSSLANLDRYLTA